MNEPRQQIADLHEAFVSMADVVKVESRGSEPTSTPISLPEEELRRLAYPDKEQPGVAGSHMRDFMEADREWRTMAAESFKQHAEMLRQQSRELDQIRQYLERSRL